MAKKAAAKTGQVKKSKKAKKAKKTKTRKAKKPMSDDARKADHLVSVINAEGERMLD